MYKVNLCSRLGLKILKPIHEFQANHPNQLYNKVKQYPWHRLFKPNQTFAIDCTAHSKVFTHSKFAALKTKDAIADAFREKFKRRPSVDVKSPDVRLHVHIQGTAVSISMDSSGDSLHLRGYRVANHPASLSEVLAAGMIALSGWDAKSPFYDFMCGSGTLPIEAAMLAAKIPAGWYRKRFAFMKWNDFDAGLWRKVKQEASQQMDLEQLPLIQGSDSHRKSIDTFRQNMSQTELELEARESTIAAIQALEQAGTIILNPPYGERLQNEDIFGLYKEIGDMLKQKCTGSTAWILSSNKEALKYIGLRPAKKLMLYNGPLACKFHAYELY